MYKILGEFVGLYDHIMGVCGQSVIVSTWTQQANIIHTWVANLIRIIKVDRLIGAI